MRAAASTGRVIVTRGTNGSIPASAATARRSVSSSAGAFGKSEAVWPSGPMPITARSRVTPSSAASYSSAAASGVELAPDAVDLGGCPGEPVEERLADRSR